MKNDVVDLFECLNAGFIAGMITTEDRYVQISVGQLGNISLENHCIISALILAHLARFPEIA